MPITHSKKIPTNTAAVADVNKVLVIFNACICLSNGHSNNEIVIVMGLGFRDPDPKALHSHTFQSTELTIILKPAFSQTKNDYFSILPCLWPCPWLFHCTSTCVHSVIQDCFPKHSGQLLPPGLTTCLCQQQAMPRTSTATLEMSIFIYI